MTLKTTKMFRVCSIAAAASLLSVSAFAQSSISSSISGVIKDENGYALDNATITVVNESTGAKYVVKTNSTGHYSASGLQPGGPYNVYVSAADHESLSQRGLQVAVSQDKNVSFELSNSDEEIVELDAYEVVGSGGVVDFGTGSAGPSLVLLPEEVEMAPSIDGGINDLARLNPFVVARTDVDYGDFQISAAGKNYRYNSVQVDGVQADDPFGLQANGLPARGNLVTKDAIQSMSVDIANYDVRYSGYTGALINIVTKSGTNEYKGSAYAYYRSDSLVGDSDRENDDDPINEFKELTYGFTYGGPIIKDKLFFFIAYEKVKNETTPSEANVELTQEQQDAIATVAAQYGIADEIGTWKAPGTSDETDDKYLAKIDWNINSKHRASFRYQKTEGETPIYYDYSSSYKTSYSSHWSTQKRTYESMVGQLFSDWNEDLSTEISISKSSYESTYDNNSNLPRIVIKGVGDGSQTVELGTEEYRQANELTVDTFRFDTHADYRGIENHTISGGVHYESTDIYNMFLSYAMGSYTYNSIEDWANDNTNYYRYRYSLDGQTAAADYTTGTLGFYIQDKWTIKPNLNLTFGLRADAPTFEDDPAYNEQFYSDFGVANNNTPDMDFVIQPRISLSWKTMEDKLRVRAGAGLFYGKVPAVWMGNSYANTGTAVAEFRAYSDYAFSTTATTPTSGTASKTTINYMSEDFEMPSDWRFTLAGEYDLGFHGIQAVGEILYTRVNKAIAYTNENLKVDYYMADGRPIYDGYKYSSYYDVIRLGNTDEGESVNVSVGFRRDRGKEDGIAFSAFYIYGNSEDVNGGTSSQATSNYYYTARADSNNQELSTSSYEIRNRFLLTLSKQFKWKEGYETTLSFVYDAHSGRPFSWVFSNDINNEGSYAKNDLFYVPTGTDDPLYGGVTDGMEDEFWAFIESQSTLANSKGKIVSRNSDRDPWQHRLDVSITQNIKIWKNVESKLFFSIYNFANLLDSDWGATYESSWPLVRAVASAEIIDGQYVYTFKGYDAVLKKRESRWAMRLGMKLNF